MQKRAVAQLFIRVFPDRWSRSKAEDLDEQQAGQQIDLQTALVAVPANRE
ncbi:hypothetical protein [Mucilaginibacter sp.]|nr:hypothetical protein [Mucilaginibacter sp.]